jgi:predicted transcriptional regulator
MNTSTLSFRASAELAEQTRELAHAFNMTSSDYVREAVREKNDRSLRERLTFLSRQLSDSNLADNEAFTDAIGDGLV